MGIGTITPDAARVAANLRSWGAGLGDAATTIGPVTSEAMRSFDPANTGLRAVDDALVRTIGWEQRNAYSNLNDSHCVERALFALNALSQRREGGDLTAGLRNLGLEDGRNGALLTAYNVDLGGTKTSVHVAPVFRTHADELRVIDHLVARSDDGTMSAQEWLTAIRAHRNDPARVVLVAGSHAPASGASTIGIHRGPKQLDAAGWNRLADHLAARVEHRAAGRF